MMAGFLQQQDITSSVIALVKYCGQTISSQRGDVDGS